VGLCIFYSLFASDVYYSLSVCMSTYMSFFSLCPRFCMAVCVCLRSLVYSWSRNTRERCLTVPSQQLLNRGQNSVGAYLSANHNPAKKSTRLLKHNDEYSRRFSESLKNPTSSTAIRCNEIRVKFVVSFILQFISIYVYLYIKHVDRQDLVVWKHGCRTRIPHGLMERKFLNQGRINSRNILD